VTKVASGHIVTIVTTLIKRVLLFPTMPAAVSRSSLPPSSAPDLRSGGVSTAQRTNQTRDARALDDDIQGDEAMEDTETGTQRRKKAKSQPNGDIPLVRDPVGEKVTDAFEAFLRTYASVVIASCQRLISDDPSAALQSQSASLPHQEQKAMNLKRSNSSISIRYTPCASTN
jgi:hypothetical protein